MKSIPKEVKRWFAVSLMALAVVSTSVLLKPFSVGAEDTPETEEYFTGCIDDLSNEDTSFLINFDEVYGNKDGASEASSSKSIVDLSNKFPKPGDQGNQKSCTAWAVAYALKSYQESQEFGWKPDNKSTQFSPAYIYNQINGGKDDGSSITQAMSIIINQGVCTLKDMPYSEKDFTTKPNNAQKKAAANFKAIECGYITGIESVKRELAKGNGVVISIASYPQLKKLNSKHYIYDDYSGDSTIGHAVCLVGYDDKMRAFKFINSWGTNWGLNGYGYIPYRKINDVWNEHTLDSVKARYGYIITDNTNQHYKSKVSGVKVLSSINIYKNSNLTQKVSSIKKGTNVEIIGFVPAKNGDLPAFKVKNGYITARKDYVKELGTVNVGYRANGGSGEMKGEIFTLGIWKKLKANTFKRTGYIFAGWHARYIDKNKTIRYCYYNESSNRIIWRTTKPNGYEAYTFKNTQSVLNFANCPSGVTVGLYAQWNPIRYTIKYDKNGGSGTMENTVVKYGISKNLRKNSFTRKGYTFKGWYAKRTSDSKSFYKNKTTGEIGWYVEGKQPKGYSKVLYTDKISVSKSSTVNNDTVIMYAQWKKV